MYAIVKAGGRQVRVAPRQTVVVDRVPQAVGDGVEFTEVLAVHNGTELTVGAPCVANAKVLGRVVRHDKGPKIRVRTFRRKKRTHRHLGHRQPLTLVRILEIEADQIPVEAEEEPEEEVEETEEEEVDEEADDEDEVDEGDDE